MNASKILRKCLIINKLLPPPISGGKPRRVNNNCLSGKLSYSLLHQAFASCGRVLSCLLLWLTAASLLTSCSKDDPENDGQTERVVLNDSTLTTPPDSIQSDSIQSDSLPTGPAIVIDTTWADDPLHLTYDNYDEGDAGEAASRGLRR